MHQCSSVAAAQTHLHGGDEAAREALVAELGLTAVGSDHLDILARRAARIMNTSIGAVSVLTGAERHLVARAGIVARVTDRAMSFCTHVTAQRTPLTVCDATRDPYFAEHPAVGFTADSVRAYCGVPITTPDGSVIAVLCVADSRPRCFTSDQVNGLIGLADTARAMLMPTLAEPPEEPLRSTSTADDPLDWFGDDDLSRWIERSVPCEDSLVAEARLRRTAPRWPRQVLQAVAARGMLLM